jgi:peptide/nickel transport system permease protein
MKTFLGRLLSHWPTNLGILFLFLFLSVALAAPIMAPPDARDLTNSGQPVQPGLHQVLVKKNFNIPHPPGQEALLGTTRSQLDVFYMLVWGIRSALSFGVVVSLIASAFGAAVGAVGGYLGGVAGRLILRVTDGMLAVPVIAGYAVLQLLQKNAILKLPNAGMTVDINGATSPSLAFLTLTAFDPLMWAMILLLWMPYARIMYMMVIRVKATQYVQAANALGAGSLRIIFRHLIPNAIAPVIVLFTRDISAVVILQASIAFAGFGGNSLLGYLLLQGKDWIIFGGRNALAYWWIWLPATLALVLFGIAWNMVGDGLNDLINPQGSVR